MIEVERDYEQIDAEEKIAWRRRRKDGRYEDLKQKRERQVAGGGQRKRCGPSEPRANAAEIEYHKEGIYSDSSGAR